MRKTISISPKKHVPERAIYRCEYFLISEKLSFYKFQIEHIISLKHGGNDNIENLAFCCPECNYYKGSDIGTLVDKILTPFYNPRSDIWTNNFIMKDAEIVGINNIGKATVNILKFNNIDRVIFKKKLILLELFP